MENNTNQNIQPNIQPEVLSQMPPQGGPMPPMPGMPMRPHVNRTRTWSERMMKRFGMDTINQVPSKGAKTIPDWLTGKAVAFFFVAMFVCWFAYGCVPPTDLWLTASISVVLFFYGAKTMAGSWKTEKEKQFLKYVFWVGVAIRLLWVIYLYFFFNPDYYGTTYGDGADVEWYMPFGKQLSTWFSDGKSFSDLVLLLTDAADDAGYPLWLGVVYSIFGETSDVFAPMCIKSIAGSYCAILIYHIAKRHFGADTARTAAIFVCLNPNMIYWCGSMMKEAEMVFVCCVGVDQIDHAFSSGNKLTFRSMWLGLLAGLYLFMFRTALAVAFFLAVMTHIVASSNRVMSIGKKMIATALVGILVIFAMGGQLESRIDNLTEAAQSDEQTENMEWRSKREGGNQFAKYASKTVFAPLIFTIPFPTFNQANEKQLLQIQLSGGSYIKNILSYFVIVVMILMLISGEWRRHVFILAYTLGYLAVLALSNFAQSGRFHMPIWPMLMLFSAYGIQIAKNNVRVRKWFPLVLVGEVFVCLAWNWFKLKGRGMI